jgi:DNA-binding CsgD family transcriptional regulator
MMGMEQGFCVGCSAALMAALFALGVMSIAWMLLIAALVAIEKLLPWTVITTGATAAALALLGAAILFVPGQVPWLTIPCPCRGAVAMSFTARAEVLRLVALGHTNHEIAKQLYISTRTTEMHRASVMRKLQFDTRAQLVNYAHANGLIGPR